MAILLQGPAPWSIVSNRPVRSKGRTPTSSGTQVKLGAKRAHYRRRLGAEPNGWDGVSDVTPTLCARDQAEEHRDEEDREECRGDHAADDPPADRVPAR